MSSTSDKLSGKANQIVGKATGNDRVQAKGEAQETKGKLKDKIKHAGDVVSEKIDNAAKQSAK
jgi:uncharacterized protein YjbJ (UPF0337 family)